jgi:anti-sigma regulatory factor (Ser/Thr protein kinase)
VTAQRTSFDKGRDCVALHATRRWPAAPATVGQARAFVAGHCDDWGLAAETYRLVLAASELVTNAVLHARTDVTVTLAVDNGVARLSVTDTSPRMCLCPPAFSHPRDGEADVAATGRGLAIVDTLFDGHWGAAAIQSGESKTVWCSTGP